MPRAVVSWFGVVVQDGGVMVCVYRSGAVVVLL